ncbi:TetR/AcrR family transcriptional regulator [Acetobacter tropicalis]|nr:MULTISPECIES: TetR/AcrR family transcriptional regulator [Acetobacter]GBR68772.1 TetR family transcriptional regulator [Acetobacter tropicalis NRIC 0312]ATJ92308.1 TetR/AcrR family transcriptional regulator [Acetobacter tropicalis]KAA8391305.1 TetR/AcrR family transcriptional regulator [Acetobacter tropicalis]KAA8391559.1 TetR/AcrR family transcriptional regulator [Acetobacter tropicalis]MBC9007835.1 TetR/AcrR family transcriptional regulator [Acetobacter tropicalis]
MKRSAQPATASKSPRTRHAKDVPARARTQPEDGKPRTPGQEEGADRRHEILEIAAELFAERGYRATSIRDIAERAGLLAGSLYYHIRSKEALFVEIHNTALAAAAMRIHNALEDVTDPWARLQAACLEMLEIQLNSGSLTLPIMNNLRSVPTSVRDVLIQQRDDFEKIFRGLVADLPLDRNIDKNLYRILLLSLLNSADGWFREGRLSREEIAEQILRIFRH